MATGLTSLEQLAASIQHSYIAANKLILQSSRGVHVSAHSPAASGNAPHQEAEFIIANESGRPPVAIPASLFLTNALYHLSALRLDFPCYTMSRMRFSKGRQGGNAGVLHSFTPTLWQRLVYTCNMYQLTVETASGQTEISFRAATEEEAVRWIGKSGRPSKRTAWQFKLTPEQEKQLRTLPETTARPVYWRASLMRIWRWLSGKSGKA